MKQLFLLFALLVLGTLAYAQSNVKRDEKGNYFAVQTQRELKDSTTVFTFTDRSGAIYPVYQNTKGRHYIGKVSKKTGKYYRVYLKEDGGI